MAVVVLCTPASLPVVNIVLYFHVRYACNEARSRKAKNNTSLLSEAHGSRAGILLPLKNVLESVRTLSQLVVKKSTS